VCDAGTGPNVCADSPAEAAAGADAGTDAGPTACAETPAAAKDALEIAGTADAAEYPIGAPVVGADFAFPDLDAVEGAVSDGSLTTS
jgi:hypothetical protein